MIVLDDSASDDDDELPRVSHLLGRVPVVNRVSSKVPEVRTNGSTKHVPVADSPPPPPLPAPVARQKKGRKKTTEKKTEKVPPKS